MIFVLQYHYYVDFYKMGGGVDERVLYIFSNCQVLKIALQIMNALLHFMDVVI